MARARARCAFKLSGSLDVLVPIENAYRAQRVPPPGKTVAVFERKVNRTRTRVLEQPRAVGLLPGSEQIDRFVDPRVRRIPDRAEVVERTQHVVCQRVGNENCNQARST